MLLPPFALTFLRRFAIALLAVVVLATVGFVSAQAYGKREFAKSRVIHIDEGILATVKPGEPANYLLIGSETFLDLLNWREPRQVAQRLISCSVLDDQPSVRRAMTGSTREARRAGSAAASVAAAINTAAIAPIVSGSCAEVP